MRGLAQMGVYLQDVNDYIVIEMEFVQEGGTRRI